MTSEVWQMILVLIIVVAGQLFSLSMLIYYFITAIYSIQFWLAIVSCFGFGLIITLLRGVLEWN